MAIGSISYSICALTFLVLFAVLLTDRRKGLVKILFLASAFASFLWAASLTYHAISEQGIIYAQILEVAKNMLWMTLLLQMLCNAHGISVIKTTIRISLVGVTTFALLVLLLLAYQYYTNENYTALLLSLDDKVDYIFALHLLLSVLGIVIIEQLYRNTRQEQKWVIKYLCIGLGGMFIYDFYMYSNSLLFQRIDTSLWQARGLVNAFIVPFIGIAIARDPLWSPDIFISRNVVFHTTALLASGIYLLLMGITGYYVRDYGGNWGDVAQTFLVFTALLTLVLFLFSRRIRARLKVLLNKHFYPYKYDYREEWLRFIKTLSSTGEASHLYKKTIISIAQIIESPGGMLWLRKENGFFECVDVWNMPLVKVREPTETPLPKFLEENEFVISIDEFENDPEVYNRLGYLELPAWVQDIRPWLIVPLIHIDKLIGFIVLEHSKAHKKHFNWEDSDLLKTAARQAASYIAQFEASTALAEAKQFEHYTKLSTYIVHDIKNLVAQLSLVASNAQKHKNNPEFIDDVIQTISNSIDKMNKMMDVLKGNTSSKMTNTVDIVRLLEDLIKSRERSGQKPVPSLGCESQSFIIKADSDQITTILGHLIQNAQDATPDSGRINVLQTVENNHVVIKIEDTGTGMDEEFINTQLFKPFRSTKGSKGMGIGVYEAREILHALGGSIDVTSVPGEGSCFTVTLPPG